MRPMLQRLYALIAGVVAGVLAFDTAAAQATRPSLWVTPYLGIGVQGEYYDGVVQFSDGGTDLLRIDPGTGLVIGAQLGYRFRPALTLHVNVATSSPDADYVEDGTLRPDVELETTQLEAGLLYDLGSFPVAGAIAPLFIGGGLSLTFHSVDRFSWDGNVVQPSTTSIGVHGLIGLDVPVGPRVSVRGQGKVSVSPLARGGLEEKIALAEGGGVTASVDGGTSSYFVLSAGVTIRL